MVGCASTEVAVLKPRARKTPNLNPNGNRFIKSTWRIAYLAVTLVTSMIDVQVVLPGNLAIQTLNLSYECDLVKALLLKRRKRSFS